VNGKQVASLIAFGVSLAGRAALGAETSIVRRPNGDFLVKSGSVSLVVDTLRGLSPNELRDVRSKRAFADADYVWALPDKPQLRSSTLAGNGAGRRLVLRAKSGNLEIELTYAVAENRPNTVDETVRIRNLGSTRLDTSGFSCGFAKRVNRMGGDRFTDVPYRVHPETGELCEYSVDELFNKQSWYSTARSAIYNRRNSDRWGAEGWAWTDDKTTLLVTKYNPDAMEWSLLVPHRAGDKPDVLQFGGAGRWKLGDPEGAASLEPGKSFTFGTTRYEIIQGGWKEAYAAFRRSTEAKGHRLPKAYNPPVHWNELYDNPLWWVGDTLENRAKMYRKADMLAEADIAKELGCECLYLDPGWDTTFGSNIWAADRLGDQKEFARLLKEKYGMELALHTPLAPWTDATEYPAEAQMKDKAGNRVGVLCSASPAYIETKVARLKKLCEDGAYFLMYDGSWFPGECWDATHGHALPLTHQNHVDAILKLAQLLHAAYPKVVIEQHDPMTGPGTPRYVPTYFMHGKKGAFDELWGYEYMVEPLDDVVSRRAMSLYYANLAYSIPIYLHIDLRKDNANALMFWWYASTCRHLGVGGKSADPAVWAAHKEAMRAYMAHKAFFARGAFYGIDETVHAHTLNGRAVLNCFNLTSAPVTREIRFKLSDIGLKGKPPVEGAASRYEGGEVVLTVEIPAMAHRLVKVGF
jgi:hypothetical protein